MTGRSLPLYAERSLSELRVGREFLHGTWQASVASKRSSCAKGCASCCLRPISVTLLEGLLLYRHLRDAGQWTSALQEKLHASLPGDLSLRPDVRFLTLRPCPLLTDDKSCAGYQGRPAVCRLHAVSSLPEHCHPHSVLSQHLDRPFDNTQALASFHVLERRLQERLGFKVSALPISAAVLYAERIDRGEMDLGEVDAQAIRDFLTTMSPTS